MILEKKGTKYIRIRYAVKKLRQSPAANEESRPSYFLPSYDYYFPQHEYNKFVSIQQHHQREIEGRKNNDFFFGAIGFCRIYRKQRMTYIFYNNKF